MTGTGVADRLKGWTAEQMIARVHVEARGDEIYVNNQPVGKAERQLFLVGIVQKYLGERRYTERFRFLQRTLKFFLETEREHFGAIVMRLGTLAERINVPAEVIATMILAFARGKLDEKVPATDTRVSVSEVPRLETVAGVGMTDGVGDPARVTA